MVERDFPRRPVVLTLRETYTKGRNSNIPDWLALADHIALEYPLVVVRDTAKMSAPFGEHRICPLASLDLDYRLALYRRALVNFSVGGGPPALCFYSDDIPYRAFSLVYEGHGSTRAEYLARRGLPVGSQWPWATADQRILWEPDSFEVMQREFDAWRS
jgi:hypothetical protein